MTSVSVQLKNNHSNRYDPKQIHYSYRYNMRLRCDFIFECRYDSGWNNAQQ